MCDNLSYENIFNIYINNNDIIIRILNFLEIILGNEADVLICEMDHLRIIDPLKSQCSASGAALLYLLTNNAIITPTNILKIGIGTSNIPETIQPKKYITNSKGSIYNENFFDGLDPAKPYIFFNVTSNSQIGGNFTGHVSNLIYIPDPAFTDSSNLDKIKCGKFYCIQSFIYLYNTQIKELSYEEFKRYITIYLHRFNTTDPQNFSELTFENINVIEYLTVTWANNKDYYGKQLRGNVLDTYIYVYEINNITTVLSRIIRIISYQHTYFKIILKYLNTNYKICNYYKTGAKLDSEDKTLSNPFCTHNIENKAYFFLNITDYNTRLFNTYYNPPIEKLRTSYAITIIPNLKTTNGGLQLTTLQNKNINTYEYFRKNIITVRKFSEDTIDCLQQIIKIYDKDIKKYILHFNNQKETFKNILKNILPVNLILLHITNYFDFLVIIGLIDIFKLRYYERFNFTNPPKPKEKSENFDLENFYLNNDIIDIFIFIKLSSICNSTLENYYIESWPYQIHVLIYIILKIFFPTIHNNEKYFDSIEKIINGDIVEDEIIRSERLRIGAVLGPVLDTKPISRSPSIPEITAVLGPVLDTKPISRSPSIPEVTAVLGPVLDTKPISSSQEPKYDKYDIYDYPPIKIRNNDENPIKTKLGNLGGGNHLIKYKFNNNFNLF